MSTSQSVAQPARNPFGDMSSYNANPNNPWSDSPYSQSEEVAPAGSHHGQGRTRPSYAKAIPPRDAGRPNTKAALKSPEEFEDVHLEQRERRPTARSQSRQHGPAHLSPQESAAGSAAGVGYQIPLAYPNPSTPAPFPSIPEHPEQYPNADLEQGNATKKSQRRAPCQDFIYGPKPFWFQIMAAIFGIIFIIAIVLPLILLRVAGRGSSVTGGM